jgi:putative transposase
VAALKFLKRIMKKYGQPKSVVTDGLCSYPAAMKEIGKADRPEGWPSAQQSRGKLASALSTTRTSHAALSEPEDTTKVQLNSGSGPQPFNQERRLVTREIYKQRRSAALAEWRTVMA